MKTRIPKPTFTPSRQRRVFCSLFFVAAAIAVLAAIGSSRAIGQGRPARPTTTAKKIAPWVVEHTANGQQAEFMVVLADQANLNAAATMRTKTERAATFMLPCGIRVRRHKDLSCDGCVNVASSIAHSTSLMQFW